MLPRPTHIVPVKAKLGQLPPHRHRRLHLKPNPHPFANHFGPMKELRRSASQQIQQPPRVQRPIHPAFGEVNLGPGFRARWFGTALKL
jgi:hypothetical protein